RHLAADVVDLEHGARRLAGGVVGQLEPDREADVALAVADPVLGVVDQSQRGAQRRGRQFQQDKDAAGVGDALAVLDEVGHRRYSKVTSRAHQLKSGISGTSCPRRPPLNRALIVAPVRGCSMSNQPMRSIVSKYQASKLAASALDSNRSRPLISASTLELMTRCLGTPRSISTRSTDGSKSSVNPSNRMVT